MNKLLIALAAALFAIPTLFGSPAEAGGRGGFRVFQNPAFHMIREYHNDDYSPRRKAKRHAKHRTYTAKKHTAKTTTKAVAKVEKPQAEAASKVVESENSSISTADGTVAEAKTDKPEQVGESQNSSISTATVKVAEAKSDKPETVAEVRDVGCKKFFAAVGMTLSVPCE